MQEAGYRLADYADRNKNSEYREPDIKSIKGCFKLFLSHHAACRFQIMNVEILAMVVVLVGLVGLIAPALALSRLLSRWRSR